MAQSSPMVQSTTYRNHLNTGLVWYLNGPNMKGCQMVRFSNGGLETNPDKKCLLYGLKCLVFKWSAKSCEETTWKPHKKVFEKSNVWFSGVWYSDGYCCDPVVVPAPFAYIVRQKGHFPPFPLPVGIIFPKIMFWLKFSLFCKKIIIWNKYFNWTWLEVSNQGVVKTSPNLVLRRL